VHLDLIMFIRPRLYRSHGEKNRAVQDTVELKIMGSSEPWYVAAPLRLRSLICCKRVNRKFIGKTSRSTGSVVQAGRHVVTAPWHSMDVASRLDSRHVQSYTKQTSYMNEDRQKF
jgi:hypothetical protein